MTTSFSTEMCWRRVEAVSYRCMYYFVSTGAAPSSCRFDVYPNEETQADPQPLLNVFAAIPCCLTASLLPRFVCLAPAPALIDTIRCMTETELSVHAEEKRKGPVGVRSRSRRSRGYIRVCQNYLTLLGRLLYIYACLLVACWEDPVRARAPP